MSTQRTLERSRPSVVTPNGTVAHLHHSEAGTGRGVKIHDIRSTPSSYSSEETAIVVRSAGSELDARDRHGLLDGLHFVRYLVPLRQVIFSTGTIVVTLLASCFIRCPTHSCFAFSTRPWDAALVLRTPSESTIEIQAI